MKRGRGCNLSAGIIDIILSVLYIISGIMMIYAVAVLGAIANSSNSAAEGEELVYGILVFVGILSFAIAALYLTFGIVTIKACNADVEVYYRKKGTLLGFSITESVLLVFVIYSLVSSFSILSIISFLVYVAAVALHWVGYGMMVKNVNTENAAEIALKITEVKDESLNSDDIEKLAKIDELRKNGTITEEEFAALKSKILKD